MHDTEQEIKHRNRGMSAPENVDHDFEAINKETISVILLVFFNMSLTFIFPWLVTMANAIPGIHDGYSYPQPPFQFDEPSTSPSPIYLPPPFQDDIPQIVPTYLPPNLYPPIGEDDSVVITAPNTRILPPTPRQIPLQVFNMSCLDSRDGYFRTFLRTTSTSKVFPVMETSSPDCVVTPTSSDTFQINLDGQKMTDCGVRSCSSRMCLILRVATVPGLRVIDDPLVTLQCIPQEAVVSHTKHLKLSAHSEQGRSIVRSVAVASGGSQRRFETLVNLLRKRSGSYTFDEPVQPGSAVRLGDELLLRTTVRDGDGWKYSRMGAVVIRSTSSQRSIFLVDENGCRVPSVRSICPQQPQQVGPLVVQLPFRAFLFQGAAPVDDLLLSVRMSGCLRPRDCYQNKTCDDGGRSRVVRDISNFTKNEDGGGEGGEEEGADIVAEFHFRVLPINDPPGEDYRTMNGNLVNSSVIFLIVILIGLTCIVIGLITQLRKQRTYF